MRVLLLSSDPESRASMSRGAAEAGCRADLAGDLPQVAELARGCDYSVVVADVDGAPAEQTLVTRALRHRLPRVRLLALGSWGSAAERIGALDAGADETLDKPVVVEELAARFRAMGRRGLEPVHPLDSLRCGDLVIDLRLHEVRRSGRLLHPTAHEYELVRFLAARPGEVVSRREIGEHVIEPEFVVSSNAVDVLVCHLRGKLGKPDLIKTVRGYGYVFANCE